jgi:hypothetical protein
MMIYNWIRVARLILKNRRQVVTRGLAKTVDTMG